MLDNLPPLFAHVAEVFVVLGITLLAIAIGDSLLAVLGLAPSKPRVPEAGDSTGEAMSNGERLVFGVALGYGMLAYLALGIGLLRMFEFRVFALLCLAVAFVCRNRLRAAVRLPRSILRRWRTEIRDPGSFFLVAVISACVGAALLKSLVPPIAQDDLEYHLALPSGYVHAHAVKFFPDSPFSLLPHLVEMLSGVGLLLGSDRIAILFTFVLSLIGPAAVAVYVRRFLVGDGPGRRERWSWLAAAIFLTMPVVGYVLRFDNTDLPQASFSYLSLFAGARAIEALETRDRHESSSRTALSFLILAGVCAGLAISTKIFAFPIVVGVVLALMFYALGRSLPWKRVVEALAAFAIPIAILLAPWALRGVLEAGNPVWPLASRIFGGSYIDADTVKWFSGSYETGGLAKGLKYMADAVARPPIRIDGHMQVVSLGPLVLPLLAAVLWTRPRAGLVWVGWFLIVHWILWAFIFPRTSTRYLMTFYLLAAVMGAYGAGKAFDQARLAGTVLGGVVAFGLAVQAADSLVAVREYLPTVLSLDRDAERRYLRAHMEDEAMIEFIGGSLPRSATVYCWDSLPRGYRMPRAYVYARAVPKYTNFGDRDLGRWRRRLAELGVTHVLYHPRYPLNYGLRPGFTDPYVGAAERFLPRYCGSPIFESGSYSLYRLQ